MSYPNRSHSNYGGIKKTRSFKGQHAYAKMGKNLSEQLVFVQDVQKNNAIISWNNGRGQVVDAHIDVKHLSHEPDKLHQLLSNDPYSKDFAYERVLSFMRQGQRKNHALQNYILEMEGDVKLLPPKLVEYAKQKGWM